MTSTSVRRLHCGSLTAAMSMFEAGGAQQLVTVPVPSWLIRHADGLVLVDAGMHRDLATPSPYLDRVSRFFDVELSESELVADALRGADVDPDDIDVVVLTHLHFDHTGGLAQVPNARVVVQRDEWAAGGDDDLAAANSFVPTDYLVGHEIVTVDGEHDVFGDGAITCLPTPGHTPGHQSVRVRLADSEIVLCGDCAYFQRTLDGGALPGFGHDLEQHAASLDVLRGLGRRGARLVPGHDGDVFAGLPTVLH